METPQDYELEVDEARRVRVEIMPRSDFSSSTRNEYIVRVHFPSSWSVETVKEKWGGIKLAICMENNLKPTDEVAEFTNDSATFIALKERSN